MSTQALGLGWGHPGGRPRQGRGLPDLAPAQPSGRWPGSHERLGTKVGSVVAKPGGRQPCQAESRRQICLAGPASIWEHPGCGQMPWEGDLAVLSASNLLIR